MGRDLSKDNKEQIHVWVLPNQVRDMEVIKQKLGKNKTTVVIEALGMYFNMLRKDGVL